MVRERWIGNYLDISNGGRAEGGGGLIIINPKTGSRIEIPHSSLDGVERVEIKDPTTGDLLVVDVSSGTIFSE